MPCRLFVKMTIFQDGSKVLVSGGNIIKINFIASILEHYVLWIESQEEPSLKQAQATLVNDIL